MNNYVANARRIVKPESEWTYGEVRRIVIPMVTSKRRMDALDRLDFEQIKIRLFEAIPNTRECTLRVGTKKYINKQLDNYAEELDERDRSEDAWMGGLIAGMRKLFKKEGLIK